MRCHAAIFDLDGTLLDTLEDLAASMNRTLAAHGFPPHPVDSYRYFVGQGMASLARATVPEGTAPEVADAVRKGMEEDYGANWAVATRPYPGILDAVAALRESNLPLAVFSNKPDQFTKIVVERFFPGNMFAHVQGARPDVPMKPDPAGALEIARALGFSPESVAYIGDTDTDMKTGVAAGMRTIGVEWGFRPELLRKSGAELIVARPEDLPGAVIDCD